MASCAGGRHSMPPPLQIDLWPFDPEIGVRVTCDVGYLCANFSLPIGLSVLDWMYATDRQKEVRRQTRIIALMHLPRDRGIIMAPAWYSEIIGDTYSLNVDRHLY